MGGKINFVGELDQLLLNFKETKNYQKDDFYVSKSNFFAYKLLDSWPNWEKNIINIHGEKYCGKSHLTEIFIKKNKGIIFDAKTFKFTDQKELKLYQNIIIDNFTDDFEEKSILSLINFVDQNSKYLIINSTRPINKISFKLKDSSTSAGVSLSSCVACFLLSAFLSWLFAIDRASISKAAN